MECDGTGKIIVIHGACERVLYVLQGLIEPAPRKRDGFDLDMVFGFDSAECDSPFSGTVLAGAVVQEQICLVSVNVETRTESPCSLRQHVGKLLGRGHGADAKTSLLVHHVRLLAQEGIEC